MNAAQIEKKLQMYQLKYNEVDKEVVECQNKIADLARRKVYYEGAFNELKAIYDELIKEEERSETKAEQPDRNSSDTDEKDKKK